MSARSVELRTPSGSFHITARKAREILKSKCARVFSQHPFAVEIVSGNESDLASLARWTQRCDGFTMNGVVLQPRRARI